MTTKEDAHDVLSALRLGWAVAEARGRNRPGGPTGDIAPMPDHVDHALPLRIERGPTELRIEVQSLVAALARELHVDYTDRHPSFGQALDDSAKWLDHARARKAVTALQRAQTLLEANDLADALVELRAGQTAQCAVVKGRMAAVTAARKALADVETGDDQDAVHRAAQVLRVEKGCLTGEARGLAALDEVIRTLQDNSSVTVGIEAIQQSQHAIATDAAKQWECLAELIWEFDAHLQDSLSAASESEAMAYQLGRGLAETYWALDPDATKGTRSWGFLLGKERCSELSRLVGRLCGYFPEYTGPAIASSVEVWEDVIQTPGWFGDDPRLTAHRLCKQIRRWFELLILGQDPTTLVRPGDVMKDYRALRRAVQPFLPQLIGTAVGLGFLVALLILVTVGSGATWAKALSGFIGVTGLSIAGFTGALKNSAQAVLKRWRQDAYTDLIAEAVQTAPRPPKPSDLQIAIRRRTLTPSTRA